MKRVAARAEGHPCARLDWPQVREIRRRHPAESYSTLAAVFGVAKPTIAAIIQGRTWVE